MRPTLPVLLVFSSSELNTSNLKYTSLHLSGCHGQWGSGRQLAGCVCGLWAAVNTKLPNNGVRDRMTVQLVQGADACPALVSQLRKSVPVSSKYQSMESECLDSGRRRQAVLSSAPAAKQSKGRRNRNTALFWGKFGYFSV